MTDSSVRAATGPEMVEQMADVVMAEAGASEANRSLTDPDRRGDVGHRADAPVQPDRGRGRRARLRRDDRDVDRHGPTGRVVRLDRDRQPAVGRRHRRVPSRRRVRRGLRRRRRPGDPGWTVLPERHRRGGRRRHPADGVVELRVGDRALGVRGRGVHADQGRRPRVGERRDPRAPRRDPAPERDHVHRRLARPGPEGHRLVRLRGARHLRARPPHLRAVHTATVAGRLAGAAHRDDGDHRGRSRRVGARACHAACSTTSPSSPRPRCGWATRRRWPTRPASSPGSPTTRRCGEPPASWCSMPRRRWRPAPRPPTG